MMTLLKVVIIFQGEPLSISIKMTWKPFYVTLVKLGLHNVVYIGCQTMSECVRYNARKFSWHINTNRCTLFVQMSWIRVNAIEIAAITCIKNTGRNRHS